MAENKPPRFVVGDDIKGLIVTLRNSDGTPIDLSGGVVHLFARGVDSGDRPPIGLDPDPWLGVPGELLAPTAGRCEFEALGSLLSPGAGRRMDAYRFMVRFTAPGGAVLWTIQEAVFYGVVPTSVA